MPCFLSHKLKLIFCHIPRTGGTSFTEAIRPFLGEDYEMDTFPKHLPLAKFRIGRLGKHFDDYLKVSIDRPEADRQASLRIGAKLAPEPIIFPQYGHGPDSEYWWSTGQWLGDNKGKPLVDVLINFDQLPGSALRFLRSIGIELDELPHRNKR
jgi:hypothetical protein